MVIALQIEPRSQLVCVEPQNIQELESCRHRQLSVLSFLYTTFWQHKKNKSIIRGKYCNISEKLGNTSKLIKPKLAGNVSLTSHNYRCPNTSVPDVLGKSDADHGPPHTGEERWIPTTLVFLVPYSSSAKAAII